jgi:hypothetical protein
VVGVGLGVSDTVEAAAQGDVKGGALAALGTVAAVAAKKSSGKKKGGKQNSSNQKPPPTKKPKFTPYEDLPPKKGFHRHHIALAGIFRRARSKRLRELEQKIGAEYLSDEAIAAGGSHHTLHRITNIDLKLEGLFPGGEFKQTYTNAEVELAISTLIDTYRTARIDDFAEYLEDLLAALKKDGLL